jgi:NADH-quinone oxidoreductase subunit H
MTDIVMVRASGYRRQGAGPSCPGNWLPLLPIFVVYFISSPPKPIDIPFDVVEGSPSQL